MTPTGTGSRAHSLRSRILGAIAVLWGGVVLFRAWRGGGPVGEGAYRNGQIAALVFAALLIAAGAYYLLRRGRRGERG